MSVDRTRAFAAAVVLVLAYLWFVYTPWGQRLDNRIWGWTTGFDRAAQDDIGWFVRRPLIALSAAVTVVFVLWRRRLDVFLTLLVSWPVTVAVAFALREALPRPYLGNHGGFPTNSFPSTHVVLAATPLIVIAIAQHCRGVLAALCGLGVVLAMFGNLMLLVHRASDTIGSVALTVAVVSSVRLVIDKTHLPVEAKP